MRLFAPVAWILLLPIGFALSAGCGDSVPEEAFSPLHRPGEDCIECHSESGSAFKTPFTIAGTVYPQPNAEVTEGVEGITVLITDFKGQKRRIVTNEVGNFYTDELLNFPVEAAVEGGLPTKVIRAKFGSIANGRCNLCHNIPPLYGTPGRVYFN